MREQKPYVVGLTIAHGGKGIPYGGHGGPREDGTENHGFKNLKGHPERLSEIPELNDSPALFELVAAISDPENGLVSVGCAVWDFSDGNGHRREGYIEFVINSAKQTADAQNYFPLFFHFDRMLHEEGFHEIVNYHWELQGASFWPSDASGFTCSISVRTPYAADPEDAKSAWEQALKPPIEFLGSYSIQGRDPLFTAETQDVDWGAPTPAA